MSVISSLLGSDQTPPPQPGTVPPITCELEVVTPMFLAGAEQQSIVAEGLRPASMKAAIRFWWRAISSLTDIHDLTKAEGRLFGDTDAGQGLTVRCECSDQWKISIPKATGSQPYLLGQGLYNHKTGVTRPAVAPGSKAGLTICLRVADTSLEKAFQAFLLLGGLGARSRRGMGALTSIQSERQPKDIPDLQARLVTLFSTSPEPDERRWWSHLTTHTRWVLLKNEYDTWQQALDALGTTLHKYRQSLGGMKAPYGEDHDLIYDHVHKHAPLNTSPRRAAFGIPHNYFFKSSKKKLDVHWQDNDRRSSPLLLRVVKLANGRHAGIALLLDGPFLPPGKKLKTKQTAAVFDPPSYAAIHEYLDILAGSLA